MSPTAERPRVCLYDQDGLRVEVRDESKPYGYANLCRVRLRVIAHFDHAEPYEKVLERMGIGEEDVGRVQDEMLDRFRRSVLSYLSRPNFPARLGEYRARCRRKIVAFPGGPS